MSFSRPATTPSSVPKGHMKCYQCRKAAPLKEGTWHNLDSHQVFLCKICARSATAQ